MVWFAGFYEPVRPVQPSLRFVFSLCTEMLLLGCDVPKFEEQAILYRKLIKCNNLLRCFMYFNPLRWPYFSAGTAINIYNS